MSQAARCGISRETVNDAAKPSSWDVRLSCLLVGLARGMRRVENCEKKMIDDSEQPANVNKAILDEVNAAAAWFHAKKTAPLWAKQIEENQ